MEKSGNNEVRLRDLVPRMQALSSAIERYAKLIRQEKNPFFATSSLRLHINELIPLILGIDNESINFIMRFNQSLIRLHLVLINDSLWAIQDSNSWSLILGLDPYIPLLHILWLIHLLPLLQILWMLIHLLPLLHILWLM